MLKQTLANNETEEALTQITMLKINCYYLKPQPSFATDIQKIKDSVSKKDINKALDDLTKVQSEVLKAENELLIAQLTNATLAEQINAGEDDEGDDGDVTPAVIFYAYGITLQNSYFNIITITA